MRAESFGEPRRISKLTIVKKGSENNHIMSSPNDIKLRAEREMNLSTELLAEAGVEEPRSIFGRVSTGFLLKAYLIIYTITALFTMTALQGRLRLLYLVKAAFTAFGAISIHGKNPRMNLLFTGAFGATVILESFPCLAGIVALFTHDICSVLAGISVGHNLSEGEEFLKFCQGNIEAIRFVGAFIISSEFSIDAFMFYQMVRYQKYLKAVQMERITLNYYTGKERIALP